MDRYRGNSQAIADLVKGHAVHRDVYVDREIFDLEMEQLFPNSWIYIGHESQLKNTGDFITSKIGNQPVLASRHRDGQVYVLHNRCPHKGVKIASEPWATPASSSAAPITPGRSRPMVHFWRSR